MYLFFLTILTANILTSLLHLNMKKTVNFLFLDVEVSRSNGKFFTSLFTNFHSFLPLTYKCSLVSCLLHQILTSAPAIKNFPRVRSSCSSLPQQYLRAQTTVYTVPKKIVHFCLPFTAHTHFKFAIKSPYFAMLLIHISTFDLSLASLHATTLFFQIRIKSPSL